MNPRELKKKLIDGFAWEGISKLLLQLLSWISTLIVARLLRPEDYGVVALSGVFIGLFTVITEMGLGQGLVNAKSVTEKQESGVFFLSLTLAILSALILLAAGSFIEAIFQMDKLASIIQVSSLGIILGSLRIIPAARIMRKLDFAFKAKANVVAQLANMATVLFLAWRGFGPWSLVFSYLVMQVVTLMIYWRHYGFIPSSGFSWAETRDVVVYSARILGSRLLYEVRSKIDVLILGLYVPAQVVGYYSLALDLATMPLSKVGSIFNAVAFPALSRIKEKKRQFRKIFLELHRILLLIGFPLLVGLGLVAEEATVVLLGEKWLPIVPIIQAFCVLNVIRLSGSLVPWMLAALGNAKLVFKASLLEATLLTLGFLIGAELYGLYGVIGAWLLMYPFVYGYLVRNLLRLLDSSFRSLAKAFLIPLFGVILMGVVVIMIKTLQTGISDLWTLVEMVGVGGLVYVFLVMWRSPQDRVTLGNLIRKLR